MVDSHVAFKKAIGLTIPNTTKVAGIPKMYEDVIRSKYAIC